MNSEFSFASRRLDIERLKNEVFDFLVIGGGITGVAVARDAASRGLRVALVEREDFASGTSSASSKLVHGGLRYLENFEFKLVFESLSERAHLIRTQPNMVRWLKFYIPVYKTDARGMGLVSIGLWLYDLLSLFRAPHFHQRLSRKQMLAENPWLKSEGLIGGFTYYDASMWDDVMCVENARAARELGAAIAPRVEAIEPVWAPSEDPNHSAVRIAGFRCRDRFAFGEEGPEGEFTVRAKRTIICGGPYTDQIGERLLRGAPEREAARYRDAKGHWRHWLKPSRGTHLVFAKGRFPIPGAMLLTNDEDGRISFVIPREDFGPGVVLVGTTDGPAPEDPGGVRAEEEDVEYLMRLITRYFPSLRLTKADILSRYVGVRPLMDPALTGEGAAESGSLSKVSREHHIDRGPGGVTLVAGGKYTTHRTMALEIVDCALETWTEDYWKGIAPRVPAWYQPKTDTPVNSAVTKEAVSEFLREPLGRQQVEGASPPKNYRLMIPDLVERYGADAREILGIESERPESQPSPEGFPYLEAQLRHAMRKELVLSLEDFYFRRLPLYLGRKDHADPWIEALAKVWAEELASMGLPLSETAPAYEARALRETIARRDLGYRS
jgi:glycerol-3-phosphate dehydrogenase